MIDMSGNEILVELLGEVEGYLPDIYHCLGELKDNSGNKQAAEELHRMFHTIRGAASMVELHELSKTAALVENAMDRVLGSTFALDMELIGFMEDTTLRIDLFCTDIRNGEVDDGKMYSKTVDAFEKVTSHQLLEADRDSEEEEHVLEDITNDHFDDEHEDDSLDDIFSRLADRDSETDSTEDGQDLFGLPDNEETDLFSEIGETDSDEGAEDLFDLQDDEKPSIFDEEADETDSGETNEDLFNEALSQESYSEDAPDIDPELLQYFNEEADEHLENINEKLNLLSATISGEVDLSDSNRDLLHSIRRSVHTLKGASAVIGIDQIAGWGHDFEDFLDWLHDESSILDPKIISAMLDGADILSKLVDEPTLLISDERETVTGKFKEITQVQAQDLENKKVSLLPDQVQEPVLEESPQEEKPTPPDDSAFEERRQKRKKRTATLRVEVDNIDRMVGLSGDMAINLSSFENSMADMRETLYELNSTLGRLKNINSSLETGYELATIPHLGGSTGDGSDHDNITEDFDPLEMDRYSELNILIRSLKEVAVDLDSITSQTDMVNDTWRKVVERQRGLLGEIQNGMTSIRMTPLSTLSNRLYRTVREAQRTTGNSAQLIIEGESMRMDASVWDTMADPIMHILRNAVAHGAGSVSSGEHQDNGDHDQLTIKINASRYGGQCRLKISDNGKGLDYDAIRQKGVERFPGTGVELMNNEELSELIFRHGFSSASAITPLSGRGVGMDVVRAGVERLNGSIQIISNPGEGVELIIQLPIAVAQLPAILARFEYQICAVPMHDVKQIVRVESEENIGHEYKFEGEMVPLIRPSHIWRIQKRGFGFSYPEFADTQSTLLIVDIGGRRCAIICDEIVGRREIIFKDLGSHLRSVPCISGVTIMGDGMLVPILNAADLLRQWNTSAGDVEPKSQEPIASDKPLNILVVDDSISVRKVLSNFIDHQGWNPVVARDGIDCVEKIRENKPDLILLDIEMPRMNGFEVLQTLQAQRGYRDIPVIMLTSRSAEKYREKASKLGARGFMTKPFKEKELTELVTGMTGH